MFSVIRSGLDASLKQLDVLSNNIANAKTTGYKRSDASFQDIYAEKASFLAPGRIGHGASLDTIRQFRSQGPLKQTNQTLDLAIEGQGMFVLKRADAAAGANNSYTRDGSFTLDNDGFIVSSDGQFLLSDLQQPIQVPRSAVIQGRTFYLNDINIDEFGRVIAQMGDSQEQIVGRVGLALFSDPTRLTPQGNNQFTENGASGAAEIGGPFENGYGKMISGAIELSNVDMTSELAGLIQAQQAFSGSSRLMQSETDMTRRLIGG
jgi:flagellar hook protein FlgE